MGKATLAIMAAGIGSRYGGGIKQLEKVGPSGELIIDYSVYDAIRAGFDKVVCIIRKDLEQDFKEMLGKRLERKVKVEYAFQELDDIPEHFRDKLEGRTKPWGTGQAVLCCKDMIEEPFLIVNADDFYGTQAYDAAFRYLTENKEKLYDNEICMVGFVLENTLSDHGDVTRGICKINADHMLEEIQETRGIHREGNYAISSQNNDRQEILLDSPVSMNMWGLPPTFFKDLENDFAVFLENLPADEKNKEFLIPQIIENMLRNKCLKVKVLPSSDQWFGSTYKEDKEHVVESIKELIRKGIYPENLYE